MVNKISKKRPAAKTKRRSPAKARSSTRVPRETAEERVEFARFLKLAQQTEREGVKFYTEVKRRIDDYNMNKFIDVILEQEREHLRIVTEVYNAEKKKGIAEAAKTAEAYHKQRALKTPFEAMKQVESLVKKKTTIYHLFQKAVEFEEGISKIYLDMVPKAKNAKVKAFLRKLADEELRHRDFIHMHQESIYNTGHWFGWDHVRLET